MFTSKRPYVAIALLLLGYLAAVGVLLLGIPMLSVAYLTFLALMGVLTAWLVRRNLEHPDLRSVTATHASGLRPLWFYVGLFFGALFVLNFGMLILGLFRPMEAYFIPIPEIVVLVILVLRLMFHGQAYNKEVQRQR